MFYKLVLLFILAALQPGKLQQEKQPTTGGENDADVAAVFDEIKTLLKTIKKKTGTHIREFRSFRDQIEDNLSSLRDDLTSLNDSFQEQLTGQHQMAAEIAGIQIALATGQSSVATNAEVMNTKLDTLNSKLELLNVSLPQHQQQTTAELARLQTSLASTNSKLSALNVTTNQLSTDHQQITEELLQLQILWKNITHPQENIEHETMGPYTCGGTRGWRRVVYLDMTDPSTTCPSGWQLTDHSKRTCGKVSTTTHSCDSVTFPVHGGEYRRVCGRIKAYQLHITDAFEAFHDGDATTIDDDYVSGVSVTHGSPRQHIWTFAAGISEAEPTRKDACPCDASITIRVPPFVGNDYFCESGVNAGSYDRFHPDDPLWDGQNCTSSSTCCSFNTPPYFVKHLPTSTRDFIEARLCRLDTADDSPIELIELYVQ